MKKEAKQLLTILAAFSNPPALFEREPKKVKVKRKKNRCRARKKRYGLEV